MNDRNNIFSPGWGLESADYLSLNLEQVESLAFVLKFQLNNAANLQAYPESVN